MEITLAKALVVKNQIVRDLSELDSKLKGANSKTIQYTKGEKPETKFEYETNVLLERRIKLVSRLIGVKTVIAIANSADYGQQERIFALSEMKSEIALLKGLECTPGVTIGGYRTETNVVQETVVQLTKIQVDGFIEKLQRDIDSAQDRMEKYNWNTQITIPD